VAEWWETPDLNAALWTNEEEIRWRYRKWGIDAEGFPEAYPLKGTYPEGVKLRSMVRDLRRKEWEAKRRRGKGSPP
jgi:hypothetical protein